MHVFALESYVPELQGFPSHCCVLAEYVKPLGQLKVAVAEHSCSVFEYKPFVQGGDSSQSPFAEL